MFAVSQSSLPHDRLLGNEVQKSVYAALANLEVADNRSHRRIIHSGRVCYFCQALIIDSVFIDEVDAPCLSDIAEVQLRSLFLLHDFFIILAVAR